MTRLGDVIELKRGYDLPSTKRVPGEFPLISSSGATDTHNEAKVIGPGVVTGRYGTIGQVFYVREDFWPLNTTLYVRDFKNNDPRFIYYFLHTLDWNKFHDKSGVPGVNRNDAHLEPVSVPDRIMQGKISAILSSFDDKIELNRRMNETLEALAQAIFKDWFVDFGPTRRRHEGATDPVAILGNLVPDPTRAAQTAALFPATFGDDGLPEGWTTRAVKELCVNITNGGTPKRDMPTYWEPGTIPWLTSGEVRKPYLIETSQFISALGFENSSAKWVEPFATVVALYGATAGQVALVAKKMTTNQAICALTSKDGYRFLIYLALSAGKESLASMATGSAQQNLSKGLVENFSTVDPSKETSKVFDDLATPLFEKIIANELENHTLAETRDYLLPKLMSGEVRLRDAKKEMP